MWVKNQDGIAVVSVDALALDPAEILKKDVKNVRIWGSIADHDFVMGVYDTVEDAKAVLNDFTNAVINKHEIFEMPKADEVSVKGVQ